MHTIRGTPTWCARTRTRMAGSGPHRDFTCPATPATSRPIFSGRRIDACPSGGRPVIRPPWRIRQLRTGPRGFGVVSPVVRRRNGQIILGKPLRGGGAAKACRRAVWLSVRHDTWPRPRTARTWCCRGSSLHPPTDQESSTLRFFWRGRLCPRQVTRGRLAGKGVDAEAATG